MTFAQRSTSTPGTNGVTHEGITCYRCNNTGHYASDCPDEQASSTTSGTTLLQYGLMLAQGTTAIDPSWILLDSQSTISVFRNPDMLTNIRPSDRTLRAVTNGGFQDSTLVGDFPNLGPVWFNPASIANILSLADVRKVCRVTMDTIAEPAMHVHRLDGSTMKFVEHECGLYVYFPSNSSNNVGAYTLVSTVAEQKKLFSRRDIANADMARTLYRAIGRPSEAEFQRILDSGCIRNCPVTSLDAKRALTIYGPDIATLKGKTTRAGVAPRAPNFTAVALPPSVLEHHRDVTLCVDFFFVQGHIFFHTISRNIFFRTVRLVSDRTRSTILHELTTVCRTYTSRGFNIVAIHGDHEFACIRDDLHPVRVDIVPADSHVGEVERSIRTVKERLRACVHGLPFTRLPKIMIEHMVVDVVRCLNMFPAPHGISESLSPLSLVTGVPPPDYNHLRLEFGSYVQLFDNHEPSNTIRARTLGAIALTPTGNAQGDYFFLSLASGFRVARHRWTALPMTDTAIARVEALAKLEDQPLIQETGLVVEWRPDHPVPDDEYDRDYVRPARVPTDPPLAAGDFSSVDASELADLHADAAAHDVPPPVLTVPDQGAPMHQRQHDDDVAYDADAAEDRDAAHGADADDDRDASYGAADDADYQSGADDDDYQYGAYGDEGRQDGIPEDDIEAEDAVDAEDDIDAHIEEPEDIPDAAGYEAGEIEGDDIDEASSLVGGATSTNQGAQRVQYDLRDRSNRITHRFRAAMDEPFSNKSYFPPTQLLYYDIFKHIMTGDDNVVRGHTMTQMSANAGIKKHGRRAEEALLTEFSQFEDLNVYEPLDPNNLTKEQKEGALRAIPTIKEKRCGKLKGRTVADGRKQKSLYDKSETASPTVATDSLMISVGIDAHEQRDVGTSDIAGAYLKAYMKDYVIMKFTGISVDILCEMNPKYIPFVTIENGVKVLYVRLIKAIYGCVQSALLWYKLFYSHLQKMGFVLNPYDPCIANKVINGKQCTIAWYVDDMKISHVDANVVSQIIEQIEERFGKMTVTRGREHIFLGMKIVYKQNGTAEITMRDYLEEAIAESGMNIRRSAATPARRDLFEDDPNAAPLDRKTAEVFHSVVAKLLYVSIRARMDILLAVIYLCTRVSRSTTDDWEKLKRVLEYLNGTLHYKYTIGIDDVAKIRSWVDASYAVHPDMKSHTGGLLSFGTGGLICKSGKQKLNTRSSTEAEVVGASDYLPNIIWVHMFLEKQGYKMKESIMGQDNESAMKLEKNGRMSAGQKSRHINIRYFWIKDRTEANGIHIRHCPTLEMLADFFTKPLQGAQFRRFRDVILGYRHVDSLRRDPNASIEERVEERRIDAHDSAPARNTSPLDEVSGKDHASRTTWADVVKGHVAETKQKLKVESKGLRTRSLSRNNPVK
ncbi:Reverse transcriptase (RNA-dependent DNA polymerase) [Fragilaria crotonensis]|nr:Reverse transcriptase (RNA-dependent DNA polymerase) [Fragilaria crotonensis]